MTTTNNFSFCRTSTFGKIGVSRGQYFDQHLKFIKLNTKAVPWTKKDLSFLKVVNIVKFSFFKFNITRKKIDENN